MRPISPKLKANLNADPYYKRCCMENNECKGRVQWHHVFRYGSDRQINEKWAILPGCEKHHTCASLSIKEIKEEFQRISLSRATADDLAEYPRMDWDQLKIKLDFEAWLKARNT